MLRDEILALLEVENLAGCRRSRCDALGSLLSGLLRCLLRLGLMPGIGSGAIIVLLNLLWLFLAVCALLFNVHKQQTASRERCGAHRRQRDERTRNIFPPMPSRAKKQIFSALHRAEHHRSMDTLESFSGSFGSSATSQETRRAAEATTGTMADMFSSPPDAATCSEPEESHIAHRKIAVRVNYIFKFLPVLSHTIPSRKPRVAAVRETMTRDATLRVSRESKIC